MKRSVVVFGSGMAAMGCLNRLTMSDKDIKITVIAPDGIPINQALVQEFIVGRIELANLQFRPSQWYQSREIELIVNHGVQAVDVASSELKLTDGRTIGFDYLIVDGSDFRKPDSDHILRLVEDCWTFDELERFGYRLNNSQSAIVVGNSLTAIRTSLSLAERGMSVQIVHDGEFLLRPMLDISSANILNHRLNVLGIGISANSKVSEIMAVYRHKGSQGGMACVAVEGGGKFLADVVMLENVVDHSDLRGIDGNFEGFTKHTSGLFSTNGAVIWLDPALHDSVVKSDFTYRWQLGEFVANSVLEVEPNRMPRPSLGRISAPGIELVIQGLRSTQGVEVGKMVALKNEATKTFKRISIRDGQVVQAVIIGDEDTVRHFTSIVPSPTLMIDASEILLPDRVSGAINPESLSGDSVICQCNRVLKSEIEAAAETAFDNGDYEPLEVVVGKTQASTACGGCMEIVMSVVGNLEDKRTLASKRQVSSSKLVGV